MRIRGFLRVPGKIPEGRPVRKADGHENAHRLREVMRMCGLFIEEAMQTKKQCLNGGMFFTLNELQIMTERWRTHYNTVRPHSA